jgi:hypothetical protein
MAVVTAMCGRGSVQCMQCKDWTDSLWHGGSNDCRVRDRHRLGACVAGGGIQAVGVVAAVAAVCGRGLGRVRPVQGVLILPLAWWQLLLWCAGRAAGGACSAAGALNALGGKEAEAVVCRTAISQVPVPSVSCGERCWQRCQLLSQGVPQKKCALPVC